MNCFLGSAIWPVLLYLSSYCIRNIKPPNLLLNFWKNKSFNCDCEHVRAVCDPLQTSWSLWSGTHQHVVLNCCLFWIFNPFLITLLEHWSECKKQNGSVWFLWRARVGFVWYLMMGQFWGWPSLWHGSNLLPWKQHLNLSPLLAPYSPAVLPGKDQF